jgi:hypothetical protein
VNKGGALGSLKNLAGEFVGDFKLAPGSGLNCGDGVEFVLTTTRRVQRKSVGGGSGKFNGFGSGLKNSGEAGGVLVLTA